LLLGLV